MTHNKMKNAWVAALALAGVVALSGCAASLDPVPDIPDTASFISPAPAVLKDGARLRVVVFGSEALSGTYEVRNGKVRLGALGALEAAGLTAAELEQAIAQRLAERGVENARVSVMVD